MHYRGKQRKPPSSKVTTTNSNIGKDKTVLT